MAVRVGPVIADRVKASTPVTAKNTLTSQNVMDLISGKATVPANKQGPLKTGYVTATQASKAAEQALKNRVNLATPAPTSTPTQTSTTTSTTTSTPAPIGGGSEQVTEGPVEAAPLPAETGNPAVDQANILASILNSPLYTESIKNAYLTQYLPGLTQANYEINRSRAQEVQNAFLRQQAQAQAIREIAGSYAARGMRTPKMVTEGFAPVQQQTQLQKNAAEQAINDLIANKEVLYGAGAQDAETFITNPIMFGSIGAGARRTALSELLALPEAYGLTQVANASRAPLAGATGATTPSGASLDTGFGSSSPAAGAAGSTPPSGDVTPTPYTGTQTAAQIQARIDAANKYIRQQQAKNNPTTVAGAQKKLAGYESELRAVRGY